MTGPFRLCAREKKNLCRPSGVRCPDIQASKQLHRRLLQPARIERLDQARAEAVELKPIEKKREALRIALMELDR